jgi:hypothetical protein
MGIESWWFAESAGGGLAASLPAPTVPSRRVSWPRLDLDAGVQDLCWIEDAPELAL